MDTVEARVGLCATCRFRRIIAGARSTFYLCERSATDPRYPRYPRLPVVECAGWSAEGTEDAGGVEDAESGKL
jgi:hypothetical protein